MTKQLQLLALVSAVGILAGCGGGSGTTATSTTPAQQTGDPSATAPTASAGAAFKYTAPAGVKVDVVNDPKMLLASVSSASAKYGPARSDPFALRSDEKKYDAAQSAERMFTVIGFNNDFTPKDDTANERVIPIEPQPYRRLSGVVVGDSIVALIDMGDGNNYLIRPGQQIPNSPWRVESIDMDKAVLVRDGDVLPKRVIVRLELPAADGGGAGGVGGGFQGGGAAGGSPMGGAVGGNGKGFAPPGD